MLLHRARGAFLFLLAITSAIPTDAAAPVESGPAASTWRLDFSALYDSAPSCPRASCRFTWAAMALALGDAGEYARRLDFAGVEIYAATHGIQQDFALLKKFREIPRTAPSAFAIGGTVGLTSDNDHDGGINTQRDARPRIPIKINGVEGSALLDTGGALSVPASDQERLALHEWDIDLEATATSGLAAPSRLAIADEVQIGAFVMRNLATRLTPAMAIDGRPWPTPIHIGYDFLLRFNVVTIDFPAKTLFLNEARDARWQCAPMWLVLDSNALVAGIATEIVIDGESLRGRIDTGANDMLLIHGEDRVHGDFTPVRDRWMIDGSGHAIALQTGTVNGKLAGFPFEKRAVRIPIPHPDFDVTVGAAFLEEHVVQLDFAAHRFCIAPGK